MNERAYFWLPNAEPTATTHDLLDSPTSERMYIDQGEVVRVRVEADEFYDDEPGPPKAQEGIQVVKQPRRPPYFVTVSTSAFVLLAGQQTENLVYPVLDSGTGAGTCGLVESL